MRYPFHFASITAFLFAFIIVHAQGEVSYERGATWAENSLPPSPEAASVTRYAGVPFNHSHGAAQYDVPLYELKGRELHIPIGLHYRSTGIKVDEIAGVAGVRFGPRAYFPSVAFKRIKRNVMGYSVYRKTQ